MQKGLGSIRWCLKWQREKYTKRQYNQVVDVWSSIFTIKIFEIANIRSERLESYFLQFSLTPFGGGLALAAGGWSSAAASERGG